MTLDDYHHKFSRLRTDGGSNRYPAATKNRAPHKPFLLLSIMDLMAQGIINENFIEPTFDLVDTWNGYWSAIMPPEKQSTMAYPFERLKSDGFWHLMPQDGYTAKRIYNAGSIAALRKYYVGAAMDDDLFALMANRKTRDQLRTVLIQTYFAKDVQPRLVEQGVVNLASYTYAQELVGQFNQQIPLFGDTPEEKKRQIRDSGFRKAIVKLYDHRCAMCGIRMLTPEGHTVVEAAHIVPWSQSQDDQPTNGLCLCRLCHWSFDEGLMSVGRKYEVLVSSRIGMNDNIPAHILPLKERPIFTPKYEVFWPAQGNLKRHRESIFAK